VLQPEPGQVAFYPIIDGIQEFRLNINSYSPEYGRSNGGTVMVSGKSGSNQLHGSVFEFFRHEKLNARNLFTPPGTKPVFRRNQYGFYAWRTDPAKQDLLFYRLARIPAANLCASPQPCANTSAASRHLHNCDHESYDRSSLPREYANSSVGLGCIGSSSAQALS
jgi:hypothetical protein